EATDVRGCVNTVSHSVVVASLPVADFTYPQICKNEPATFEDQSFVALSDIVAWQWYIGGELQSTTKDASFVFETTGFHEVTLTAYSIDGCQSSVTKQVEIIETPDLLIQTEGGCLNEAIIFVDATANKQTLQTRNWMVDGKLVAGTSATLSHVFTTTGIHAIAMNVSQTSGCSGTVSVDIVIPADPILSFGYDNQCENESIIVTDYTTPVVGNEVISRVWRLDGVDFGNGLAAILPTVVAGNYTLSLGVQTAQGCEISHSEIITITDAPEIQFAPSNNYGVPPFVVNITDQSAHVSNYTWYLDDKQVSTAKEPNIAITTEGTKVIKLIAQSASGCIDSLSVTINSALPVIDLAITQLQLVQNGNTNNIILNVINRSNIPVEILEFTIELENDFMLNEQVLKRLDVNQQSVITMSTGIPGDLSSLGYLCVKVNSPYQVADQTPTDNENCQNLATQKIIVEPPYPNPARDNTIVRAVIPSSGQVIVSLINMSGEIQIEKVIPEISSGLNIFDVDLRDVESGTYIIHIRYAGGSKRYRVVKQ
ncbi:MAG: PKD repeat protein, partial [Cyclobacteriaceae bacterium]